MTVEATKFESLKSLPFADGTFETTGKIHDPITFTLDKDSSLKVTIFPIHDYKTLPSNLIKVIQNEFNFVVEEGRTYPHHNVMIDEEFIKYWFHAFVAVLVEGEYTSIDQLNDQHKHTSVEDWEKLFLGNFYVKPNYIGRCSHVCNAGFIVNHQKRGLGLGKELGKKYLLWAPKLGYVYSVFNLVFETNVASLKIWDNLGFERIGYVKNVAVLKGEDKLVGAIMFGKDL
ncbi:hypothetical protein DFJ63DRAFT_70176 [Scheffersomyces coipomensis]|uniref:uncharacterized protein n=1 Tax=Scheffersomyces coipomensis TaxID=1788519 RepID=UPI00315CBAC2